MSTYENAGVNIHLGDLCSRIMSEACEKTFKNTDNIEVLEEEGLHRIITIRFGNINLMLNSDGVGTKVEIAERTGNHTTIAYDLIAMLCDDSVRFGARPIAATNILDVNKSNEGIIRQLASGLEKAASEAGIAVVSGEIAELGERVGGYGEYNYNWCGTVLSIVEKDKMLTGRKINPGDVLVGLREFGFRSNGLSLVRKIMEQSYGDKWHEEYHGLDTTFGNYVLKPSRIYSKAVLEMLDNVKITGIAHITGGGIPGKLGRILKPNKLGAILCDTFAPCDLMLYCQEIGDVSDEEAYKVWNMGQGMIIATLNPDEVISIAEKHGAEAKWIGYVLKNSGIHIKSQGYFKRDKLLHF